MSIQVTHTVDRLDRDLRRLPGKAVTRMSEIVRDRTQQGQQRAFRSAFVTAGEHGRHYPRSILAEMVGPFTGVYGPVTALAQGGMSFERGSRNQPPHRDLEKSADWVATRLDGDAKRVLDRLFW